MIYLKKWIVYVITIKIPMTFFLDIEKNPKFQIEPQKTLNSHSNQNVGEIFKSLLSRSFTLSWALTGKKKKNYFLSYLFTALYFFKQFKKETGGG